MLLLMLMLLLLLLLLQEGGAVGECPHAAEDVGQVEQFDHWIVQQTEHR